MEAGNLWKPEREREGSEGGRFLFNSIIFFLNEGGFGNFAVLQEMKMSYV